MRAQIPNIKVIRSAWRRVKNDIKDAIIRDLKPVKDVKGGRGATPPPRRPTGWLKIVGFRVPRVKLLNTAKDSATSSVDC